MTKFPAAVMTKRNATGHILEITVVMPLALEALSQFYNFR